MDRSGRQRSTSSRAHAADPTNRTIGAVAVLLGLACLTACSDRPESFQTACDHLAAANDAVAHGDITRAKVELNDAYDWGEPVYEDAAGTEYAAAVGDFYRAVGMAVSHFGTEDGQQALNDAEHACS
ncbi:MAG TPA: hypothetical protein VH419_10955 [Nocardioidaceae bacterium]